MKESIEEAKDRLDKMKDYLQRYASWIESLKCCYGINQYFINSRKDSYAKRKAEYDALKSKYEQMVEKTKGEGGCFEA